MAFIEPGDQFIALQKGRWQRADDGRHFGLVVNDKEAARRALRDDAGLAKPTPPMRAEGRDRHACDIWLRHTCGAAVGACDR